MDNPIDVKIPINYEWEWSEENVNVVRELHRLLNTKEYIMVNSQMQFQVLRVNRESSKPDFKIQISMLSTDADGNESLNTNIDMDEGLKKVFKLLENIGVVYLFGKKISLVGIDNGYEVILNLQMNYAKPEPDPKLMDED